MAKTYQPRLGLALLLIVLLQSFNIDLCAKQASLTWIGTLGGSRSAAFSVSDDGLVVAGRSNDSIGSYHAILWTASEGIRNLGTLGGAESEATGISSDGSVVVGWSYDSSSTYRAFRWTAADGMQDIGAGDWSKASGVSADGQVIAVNKNNIAYRWTLSGGLENLGNLGGTATGVTGVSSDGSVLVGFSNNVAGDPYAFRWADGSGMSQIGTFYSFANGVSGDGSTATGSETGSAGLHRAFSWTQSGGFVFNIAGNFSQGNAVSGNGSIIVGDNGGGAFRLSTAGGLEELKLVYSGLLAPGSDLYSAFDISADGNHIAGYGLNGTTARQEGFLLDIGGPTSVDEPKPIPGKFALHQNYPNPFNPSTSFRFEIPTSAYVSLRLFNVMGQEVKTLVNGQREPGMYTAEWDGSGYPSGVYFCRLQAGAFVEMKKLVLLR